MRVGLDAKSVKITFYPHWFVFYRDMTLALLNHEGRGGGGVGGEGARQEVIHGNGPVNSKPLALHSKCLPLWV